LRSRPPPRPRDLFGRPPDTGRCPSRLFITAPGAKSPLSLTPPHPAPIVPLPRRTGSLRVRGNEKRPLITASGARRTESPALIGRRVAIRVLINACLNYARRGAARAERNSMQMRPGFRAAGRSPEPKGRKGDLLATYAQGIDSAREPKRHLVDEYAPASGSRLTSRSRMCRRVRAS